MKRRDGASAADLAGRPAPEMLERTITGCSPRERALLGGPSFLHGDTATVAVFPADTLPPR